MFLVQGFFECRVSGAGVGCRVSGVEFQVQGFECRVSVVGVDIPGVGFGDHSESTGTRSGADRVGELTLTTPATRTSTESSNNTTLRSTGHTLSTSERIGNNLKGIWDLYLKGKGQHLALTVLYVPYSPDSGPWL